jgi:hypothetical protein
MTAGRTNITGQVSWNTPPKYVNAVREVLGTISLDPCSNDYSLVNAETQYVLPVDGLNEPWDFPTIFLNPPYGRDSSRGTTIADWIKRASNANRDHGSEVLALIPVATNTRHFKDYVFGTASAICFLADTRLKFYLDGEEWRKVAPMACCMVYWGEDVEKFQSVFSQYGTVLAIR